MRALLALLLGLSLLAGLVDAIVGGGGLILLPALFATFPGAAPATSSAATCGGKGRGVNGKSDCLRHARAAGIAGGDGEAIGSEHGDTPTEAACAAERRPCG